jgi:8-oxo-dGTP diphosphatase
MPADGSHRVTTDGSARVRTLRVVAALLERDAPSGETRMLVARRQHPPEWAGWWEFPGGKVEAGESDEAALVRELAEELGVRAEVHAPLVTVFHVEPARRIAISVYRARLTGGEPVAREHDALAWATRGELPSYRLLPADLVVLRALADTA